MVLENKVFTLPIIFMHLLMLESILLYGPYAAEQEPTSSVDGYFHHLLSLVLCLSYKPVYLTILKSEQHSEHSVLQMYVFLLHLMDPTHCTVRKCSYFFVTDMAFHTFAYANSC